MKLASQDSSLQININDEYEWVGSGETVEVCEQQSTSTPAYSLICTAGNSQTLNIPFTENQISVEDSGSGKTVSAVSRTPQSSDDTLNLYLFLSEKADSLSAYTLKAALQYTKVYGGMYQASATLISAGEENPQLLYAKGINASYLSTLNSLYVKAETTGDFGVPSATLSHAVVQRVRAGVVVETYYFDLNQNNAVYGVTRRPESVPNSEQEEQVVSLSFGANTSDVQLFSENYDVAVSIRYTSTNDISGTKTEYRSAYIYLTDQQINSIKAGKIVDVTFTEPYVEEITGITMTTSVQSNSRAVQTEGASEVVIAVDSAIAATYRVQTQQVLGGNGETTQQETRTCTGWYSFAEAVTLSNAEQTVQRTSMETASAGTVTQLTMQLVTAAAEEGSGSGHSGKISMTIGYTNTSGANQEVSFDDIRSYLTSGDFSDGSTATLRFQLTNISEVRWISLTPKSDDNSGTATWKLESISGTLKTGDKSSSFARTLNRYFNESEDGKINMNIKVSLTAETTSLSSGNVTTETATNDTASLLAESGQPVKITVNVSGSTAGFNVSAEEFSIDTDAGKNVNSYLYVNGSTITFNAPANYSGENINYRVIVTSKEVPSCKAVINITVQHEEKPVESTNQSSDETSGNTQNTGDGT